MTTRIYIHNQLFNANDTWRVGEMRHVMHSGDRERTATLVPRRAFCGAQRQESRLSNPMKIRLARALLSAKQGASSPHNDHGPLLARIRATVAHRAIGFDRRWRRGASRRRVAVTGATGSAGRLGRAGIGGAQRVLIIGDATGDCTTYILAGALAGSRTVTGAPLAVRPIDPPCPLSSSRRAFFWRFRRATSTRRPEP